MPAFLLRRLGHGLLVLWLVTTATFLLLQLSPGGPSVLADPKLTAVERAVIERELGLDQPPLTQYLRWQRGLLRGDLGRSFLYQTPTLTTILERLPATLLLVGTALAASILVSLTLGLLVTRRPGAPLDRIVTTLSFAALALPTFWLAIVAILIVAAKFHLLPAGGAATPGDGSLGDRLQHLVLPAAVLMVPISAELIRFVRSSLGEARTASHLGPAIARGVRPRRLQRRHIARNALLPIITALGLQVPLLVGGAAVTESVFGWPGMGRLGIEAALGRDYPLVMGIAVVVAVAVVLANLVLDLWYGWIDPRIRLRW
jgi:peptide/nickel transport system permease protein